MQSHNHNSHHEIIDDEKYLSKMPDKKQKSIKELSDDQQKNLDNLVEAISSAGLEEFIEYIRSPWKMLWPNFIAGVARGVGALVGAAVVIAIIGWILTQMVSLPLIGKSLSPYVQQIQEEINKYTESTNYKSNFIQIEKTLKEIRDDLKSPLLR